MQFIRMTCPACGGAIDDMITGRFVTCEYCGSRLVIDGENVDDFVEDIAQAREDRSSSALSMPEFAEAACRQFLDEIWDNSYFDSSNKILRGLGIDAGENVFLIHDDTIFHSGKNGFAITERGLYCRELAESTLFFTWDDFKRMEQPKYETSYVTCGNRHVCYFTGNDDMLKELVQLYVKLHNHAKTQRG